MYHTTGFTADEITDLVAIVHQHVSEAQGGRGWPPSLGLRRRGCVTLAYLRRNRVQQELAEAFGTSQPTVSRAITATTPLIGAALEEWIPVADEIDPEACFVLEARCFRAGAGPITRNCSPASTRPPG
jgi:hypothetical protein